MSARNSAKAVVINNGKLLVNRCHSRFGEYFTLPGGGQRTGEMLTETVRRELLEETGYTAADMQFLFTGPSSPGLTSETLHFFLARGLQKRTAGGGVDGENITVYEVPLADIDSWLQSRMAAGIAVDPRVYTGLYFLQRGA